MAELRGNVLRVTFGTLAERKTRPLTQYDYGQVLKLEGLPLPEAYEVHFSSGPAGESKTTVGDAEGAPIPDEYLTRAGELHAWVFVHTGAGDGETVYHAIIPVLPRARPTDGTISPVEQSAISRIFTALQTGVDRAEAFADRAEQGAASAGYMDFSIDAAGHLIYQRGNVDSVDFELQEGRLVAQWA